jgi:hypothetical protein
VRDFEIIDIFPYGIDFAWDKDGERITSTLFERNGPIPSAKMLTFFRRAACAAPALIAQCFDRANRLCFRKLAVSGVDVNTAPAAHGAASEAAACSASLAVLYELCPASKEWHDYQRLGFGALDPACDASSHAY